MSLRGRLNRLERHWQQAHARLPHWHVVHTDGVSYWEDVPGPAGQIDYRNGLPGPDGPPAGAPLLTAGDVAALERAGRVLIVRYVTWDASESAWW